MNPAMCAVLSNKAGVTQTGRLFAHGSIVAREYSIPVVMGTRTATQRIRDGEIITGDGSTGRVVLNRNQDSTFMQRGNHVAIHPASL